MQDWISAWQSRSGHIGILLAALVALSIALVAQKRFSVRPRRLRRLRTLFLLFTVGFIGWTAQGQLTIVNITAAIESLSSDGDLSFFLNDPMTVILWVFVGLTLLVWGRGTFCGWLCPFGALQELISLLANALGRRQRRLRAALDARLKWIKYLILAALMVSLYASPPMAEWLVEVEPFKTAISLYFVRDWPYLAWAIFCLLLSVFVYRGYCRYLCPLCLVVDTSPERVRRTVPDLPAPVRVSGNYPGRQDRLPGVFSVPRLCINLSGYAALLSFDKA
jgi:hypothetical protein